MDTVGGNPFAVLTAVGDSYECVFVAGAGDGQPAGAGGGAGAGGADLVEVRRGGGEIPLYAGRRFTGRESRPAPFGMTGLGLGIQKSVPEAGSSG
jgi:hypothetical protein